MDHFAENTPVISRYRGRAARGRAAVVVVSWLLVLFSLPAIGEGQASEAGPDKGKQKAVQCIACHGAEGQTTNPGFPDLAGQNAAYLQNQLISFKSGSRYHSVMTPIAKSLSDEDIRDLAAYFSELEPVRSTDKTESRP